MDEDNACLDGISWWNWDIVMAETTFIKNCIRGNNGL